MAGGREVKGKVFSDLLIGLGAFLFSKRANLCVLEVVCIPFHFEKLY